jgi:ubiquinone biosynthesis protein COQ4
MSFSLSGAVRAARALHAYVTIVRDPNQLEKVFELRNVIAQPEVLREMAAFFARDPGGADAIRTRPRIGKLDLKALAAMPAGTLGQAFGRHMLDAGLDPSALPDLPSSTDLEFLDAHLYETHDVWHVVTGFGTDVAGELGLQAFYLAQFPARLSLAILSGGLLNTLVGSGGAMFADRDRRMDAIAAGWLMGRAARPFFGVRWGEMWDRPLDEVRRELKVTPAAMRGETEQRSDRSAPSGERAPRREMPVETRTPAPSG